MSDASHPCLRCGACCAAFRVAFHWSETDAHPGGHTPAAATEALDPHRVVMRGTYGGARLRCEQLRGDIALDAHCGVYPLRPSPCREVKPAWEDGAPSAQCDKARAMHGMAALTPDDWTPAPRPDPGRGGLHCSPDAAASSRGLPSIGPLT